MNVQNVFAIVRSGAKQNWILLAVGGSMISLIALLMMWRFSATPPILSLNQARLALSQARHAGANWYAPEFLQAAERSWEEARLAWHRENTKWSFWRDFDSTRYWAVKATRQAQTAKVRAIVVHDSLKWVAAAGIAFAKQKIDEHQEQFRQMPVAESMRRQFVIGELLVRESELAFNRDDFQRAVTKFHTAVAYVGGATADVTKFLQVYLSQVPEWQSWAEETIAWSAQQNAVAVIVDKMAHRCHVYSSGRLLAEYSIELGPRWLGHKKQKGDGATPEGRYRVTKKKDGRHTKYYKALEIDYPNETDRQQFLLAQKNGEVSKAAHIGGLIEIHGNGGQGVNWTAGCVALNNKDIDRLYEIVRVGTPVTIVGSLKAFPSIQEALKSSSNHRSARGWSRAISPKK